MIVVCGAEQGHAGSLPHHVPARHAAGVDADRGGGAPHVCDSQGAAVDPLLCYGYGVRYGLRYGSLCLACVGHY
jgi:hypothetical protein